jgi:hypothetical protein
MSRGSRKEPHEFSESSHDLSQDKLSEGIATKS